MPAMEFKPGETGSMSVVDYISFAVLCFISSIGGFWYSITSSKKKNIGNIDEYLLGNKSMKTFPVTLSLIASYLSPVTVLGTPTEIYNYGSIYWLVSVGIVGCCITVGCVHLPVFMTLKLRSSYEYLELRFNRHVRGAASLLFMFDEVFFLPMVVYTPALAFNRLTGVNTYAVGGVTILVCGIYTVLGGLKAVVWTDALQTGIMYLGLILTAVGGTICAGGFQNVVDIGSATGRLDFTNWSTNPYERQTGWAAIFGGYIYWTCFNSVNQTMVQRYLALPTKEKAWIALSNFGLGAFIAVALVVWSALAAWATWVHLGCWKNGSPPASDWLLPSFVLHISDQLKIPCFCGVFLASIFCAGISSLSAILNACALVVVTDLLHGWGQLRLSPRLSGIVARVITAFFAVLSLAMVLVVEKLGGVLGVAMALSAIAASVTCGVFTLGMLCWWVRRRGALWGAIFGSVVAGTASLGRQFTTASGANRDPVLPVHGQCAVNASFTPIPPTKDGEVFPLFRISYQWIAPLGLLTTMVVGMIVGALFDDQTILLDPELISPLLQRFVPKKHWAIYGTARRSVAAESRVRTTDRVSRVRFDPKAEMREQERETSALKKSKAILEKNTMFIKKVVQKVKAFITKFVKKMKKEDSGNSLTDIIEVIKDEKKEKALKEHTFCPYFIHLPVLIHHYDSDTDDSADPDIQKFVIAMYNRSSPSVTVNECRKHLFTKKDRQRIYLIQNLL